MIVLFIQAVLLTCWKALAPKRPEAHGGKPVAQTDLYRYFQHMEKQFNQEVPDK